MAQKEQMAASLDLRGLDLVTPVDLIKDGHTPFAKNFRLYAQQSDDRRVAASSRKGPGFYINPLNETLSDSNTAVLGASTAEVGIVTGIHAIPVTAASNDRLTRIDINVADTNGADGPIMVQIWSDNGGTPGKLLTESSLLGGDIGSSAAYVTARFVKAIKLTSGSTYWIVLRMQDDGDNTYTLSTTTSGTKAYKSDSTLSQLTQQTYALNYKLYTTPDVDIKGAYRFARDNGVNLTLVAIGNTMYRVDETTHTLLPIISGLNANAVNYNFTNGDNKVFWVNSYDQLTAWNGAIETTANNIVTNPTFETNTAGWTAAGGGSGISIARTTADFHSGAASMLVSATSGGRASLYTTNQLKANHRYKFTAWVKGITAGQTIGWYATGPNTSIGTATATGAWQQLSYYFTPTVDMTSFDINSSGTNFYVDDVNVIDTGIEYIIDNELPILSDVIMHKDRLWGVSAADPNRLVFSENPGNPAFDSTGAIATTANQQWYYAWLSVSFIYVPRPHNGSPITGLVSFQDALTVFTQDNKYVITGYDRGSLNMREATGSKGALSRRGITVDENMIYFVGDDGFYQYNGSQDVKISGLINPLFDGCGQKLEITPIVWKNEVRFYMASEGSPVNDTCVIYNKDLKEMEYDTDTFIERSVYYNDADDQGQLIEFSSVVPTAYVAEVDYHALGAPIDFEYRLKYDSMGSPAQKKRIRRYYPILQGVDRTFTIQLAMDKDFENSPRVNDLLMVTNGAKLGEFKLGDGTVLGGDTSFRIRRQSYSGYAYYWQLRVIRKGVLNRVAFIGAQYSYKTKRL